MFSMIKCKFSLVKINICIGIKHLYLIKKQICTDNLFKSNDFNIVYKEIDVKNL